MQEILDTSYMKGCEGILEAKLGPQNYVRGLSQLSPGRQPVLTNLSSEVSTVVCILFRESTTFQCLLLIHNIRLS